MHLRLAAVIPAVLVLALTGAACPASGADAAAPGSGSAARSGALGPSAGAPSPAIPADCPVPVCRYQGTSWAEDLIGDELLDRGEARVVWRFSHMSGREAVYVPAGTVTASWGTERCAIALDPGGQTFTAADPSVRHARLHVDFTSRPIRYSGIGTTEWKGTQTWSCRGDAPFTQDGVSTTWFSVNEATSDDAGLLRGNAESGSTRSGWELVNSP